MEPKSHDAHLHDVEESGDLVGRVIAAKYAVLSVIGQGAMGIVYRARQVALDKVVAVKVLGNDLRGDPEFVARFHTEARAASRLDHPNSTRVLDFGDDDGLLYIAMELLQGRSLAEVLAQEFPLENARVISIMSQTLSAVGAAHGLKILHRDLKPENIVILDGRDDEDRHVDVVKVCDFGIAKLDGVEARTSVAPPPLDPNSTLGASPPNPGEGSGRSARLTRAGAIIGTPQYMSPEQARGEPLDVRSDLYSLGVVLYELLTRRAPFDEGTPAEVLFRHSMVEPGKPSLLRPEVDPALEAICMRALEKKRDDRYASARDMRRAFVALQGEGAPRGSVSEVVPRAVISGARLFDPGVPTISATALVVAPKKGGAGRVVTLLIAALAVAAGAFFVIHRAQSHPDASRTQAQGPAIAATQTLIQTPSQTPTLTLSPMPTFAQPSDTASPTHRTLVGRPAPTATTSAVAMIETATATTTEVAPPPPPTSTATITAPPPTTTAIERVIDPARARVDVTHVQADRVTVASVESMVHHIELTSCYRTALTAQSREPDGNATLSFDTDEDGMVTRADLAGAAFSQGLRTCVARRVIGQRVPNVDTGAASAKLTLRFSFQ